MIRLTKALSAWGSPDFADTFKNELAQLDAAQLPLQQGLSMSSHALGDSVSVMIIRVSEVPEAIRVKAGIFYSGIVAGCSCADDPTPVSENSEYCEVQVDISKETAETTIALLAPEATGTG